jgi:hypothetical protein
MLEIPAIDAVPPPPPLAQLLTAASSPWKIEAPATPHKPEDPAVLERDRWPANIWSSLVVSFSGSINS